MIAPDQKNRDSPHPGHARLSAAAALGFMMIALGTLSVSGCAADEPVGHKKTTTKTTVETPTEKTTVTETHEKNTTLNPR